jgi:hypothetical protein
LDAFVPAAVARRWRGLSLGKRLLLLAIVLVIIGSAAGSNVAPFVIAIAIMAAWWIWRQRRKEREHEASQAAIEAERQRWISLEYSDGPYTVMLTGFAGAGARYSIWTLLSWLPAFRDSEEEVEALIERVVHIGPQPIAQEVSQRDAIRVKTALEDQGAKIKITELRARAGSGARESIPQSVRNAVWNRDKGRCVDCGSRERLEYDHIIPIAKGGSNTARNLELRCETCNRKKGAKI